MLARRRRRQKEKNKQKSIEAAARDLVEQELEAWKERVTEAKNETETKRRHYRRQEDELRRIYDNSCQQLDQRRDKLLATTSLIPYTQTIQAASNFRVPAALLTLQARLCLHVHCLCVHEELLLKTKEQGWDTIAWMEDVSRQLRMLTQKQIMLLQEKASLIQQTNSQGEIPEKIRHLLQHQVTPEKDTKQVKDSTDTAIMGRVAVASPPRLEPQQALRHAPSKEESFLEFLQRYEERKAHQQKADQMRLAEFRSRGDSPLASGAGSENPYTFRRAGVGKKLKTYASKLFQGASASPAAGDMDESLHLDDIQSTLTSNTATSNNIPAIEESASGERQSWIPFMRQQRSTSVLLSQSESKLDVGWSLGSSLRGIRKRGSRNDLNGSSTNHGDEHENAGDESTKDTVEEGRRSNKADDGEDGVVDVENDRDNNSGRVQSTVASPLKTKLKAPVMHKFFESARW